METRNILLLVYLSIYCPLLWMIFWRIVNMNVYERIRPLDFVLFVVLSVFSKVYYFHAFFKCVILQPCLFFCPFSFGHCMVCSSSIYGF